MAILKMAKDSNILENNMVQTQASAAGTLSAIIFIIPGMLMIGYWQGVEFWQTLIVSACGGCAWACCSRFRCAGPWSFILTWLIRRAWLQLRS